MQLGDRARELFRPRLEVALAAGTVRPDLTLEDLMVMLAMISGALTRRDPGGRAEAARRAFEMVLDGLRSRA